MGSTYASLHYHIVFATKDRRPFIKDEWRDRLHEYLGGTVNGLGGFTQGVGGVADHVHLLVGLKQTHRISDFMRTLKGDTSKWVHETVGGRDFAWQEGYAVFTVGVSQRESVRRYIANQVEHHRVKSFREELEELLRRAGLEYDPKYLV